MRPTKSGWVLTGALLGWSMAPSASLAQTEDGAGTLEARRTAPSAVNVWNRPLVVLRAAIDGVSPEERADGIRRRIEELPPEGAEIRSEPASIRGLEGIAIFAGTRMLFGLVPLARSLRGRSSTNPALVGAASSAALSPGSSNPRGRRDSLASYLGRNTVHILSAGIILFAVYIFVAFALSQFPYTRPWGEGLGRFLIVHLFDLAKGALVAVPGFFTAALIFVVGKVITRAVSGLFERAEKGQAVLPWLDRDTARATRRIFVVLIWVFVLTAAYPYIPGSRTEAFKAISVFVGLMASLGGVGFVNQIMSGLVVVYSRSLRVGDYVRVGDREGVVSDVGALSTKIVTVAREEVTVPNAVLVGTTVTNFSKLAGEDGAGVQTTVTIGYDAPWRQVHALLELAADRTKGLRKNPKPRVLQRALSDFYVEYQLLAHLESADGRIPVLSELHAQIQDAFNEFGVQIMSPHFESQPMQKVFVAREGWNPAPTKEAAS